MTGKKGERVVPRDLNPPEFPQRVTFRNGAKTSHEWRASQHGETETVETKNSKMGSSRVAKFPLCVGAAKMQEALTTHKY